MANLTHILGGNFVPPSDKIVSSPEVQITQSMLDVGITPPKDILFDGRLHRFCTSGKRGNNGWYIAYSDGVPSGVFGDWKTGQQVNFRADIGRKLTMMEEVANTKRMAEARALRDFELKKSHEAAANTIEIIWDQATHAISAHEYLSRKGIDTHGSRVTGDGRLVVPLYDADNNLSSLQYISIDGDKRYHSGAATSECMWSIGDITDTIYIAEGFATAATIYQETGQHTIVAYSASNLVPVTRIIRDKYGPLHNIVIVADNDESGVGQKYADQASAKYGALVVMPPSLGDANDYMQAGGNLSELLNPSNSGTIEKLKVLFGDNLSSEFEPPNELVEGLITIGGLSVVYGDSNSGKTFWALSVAAAIASGVECYGRKVDKGLVIYLATESPASIKARMQAIKKYYGCNLENLAMVPVPMNFYNGDKDAYDIIQLVKEIEEVKGKKVHLIIGDTLARLASGANENSGEDMAPVMARFDRVAEATKAALMLIHHSGKNAAAGARGWSGLRAHIDTEIEVLDVKGVRSVSVTKQRELSGKGDTIYFKLEILTMGTNKFGGDATTCVAIQDDNPDIEVVKKDSVLDGYRQHFNTAWFSSGAELRQEKAYISRSAFKEYLQSIGFKGAKLDNEYTKIFSYLIKSEVVLSFENGYILNDLIQNSALIIRKEGERFIY